jgi:hypothetical protein
MLQKTIVSSQNRFSGSSSNFKVKLTEPTSVKAWQLDWILIPLTIYNISTTNNVITFTENSTLKTATIPVGSYTADVLCDEIQNAMDTASGGYNTFTVGYNSNTFKISFSAGNPFILHCSANLFPYSELGFNQTDTSSSTSVVATLPVNLAKPHAIVVSIPELDTRIITGSNAVDGVCIVPVGLNIGRTLYYEPENKTVTTLNSPRNVSAITIKLCDADNNIIDLNGSDWTMSLSLFV